MPTYPKTRFETNNNLTRKKWARDLYSVLLKNVEFSDLVGKGSDAIVQIRTDLSKGQGDTITFGIRRELTGAGVVGRNTVEGNEEQLLFKDFAVTVEELNHAVDTGGAMDRQRVPYDLMKEGRDGLQDWWVDKLSDLVMHTLAGDTSFKIDGETFANTITAPDVGHYLAIGQAAGTAVATAEAALTSADEMTLAFLDRMKQLAETPYSTNEDRMRKKNGMYRVYMHNFVFDSLRRNTNVGEWGDLLRLAGKLKNPHVEIVYNGMAISKTERLTAFTGNDNIYRTILMGPQAGVWAWGGAGESKSSVMAFVPYEKDAKRYVMIRGGGIFGTRKTRFNSRDYSVITGSSYAVRIA